MNDDLDIDFVATCRDICARLRNLLPHAEALDQALDELLRPAQTRRSKRRSNGADNDTAVINAALEYIDCRDLTEQITRAIDAIETELEDRIERDRAEDLRRLQGLRAEAAELAAKLGLPPEELTESTESHT